MTTNLVYIYDNGEIGVYEGLELTEIAKELLRAEKELNKAIEKRNKEVEELKEKL